MEKMKKIAAFMKTVFGYGMLAVLGSGVLMFLGYLTALIIGGEIAAVICEFIYKQAVPVVIYATSLLMLFGLLAMYLSGEAKNSPKKQKPKSSASEPESENDNGKTSPEENGEQECPATEDNENKQ